MRVSYVNFTKLNEFQISNVVLTQFALSKRLSPEAKFDLACFLKNEFEGLSVRNLKAILAVTNEFNSIPEAFRYFHDRYSTMADFMKHVVIKRVFIEGNFFTRYEETYLVIDIENAELA